MVTVVCTRWLDAFPASYVRLLRNAVRANLSREHRFLCVTDNTRGLDRDIEGVQMPDMGIPLHFQKHGCWPKLSIFAPGLLPPDEPTLYLDLDMMVRSGLDSFFEQIESKRGFHALREWNPTLWSAVPLAWRPDRGVQGSILGFIPSEQRHLYDEFMANQNLCFERYVLDQDYLSEMAKARTYWPHHWTASFKWHCVRYYPFNRIFRKIREPRHAKIVVFHGSPRPIDVVPLGNYRWGTSRKFGYGPVDWVRKYWLTHDEYWNDSMTDSRPVAAAA
jgi:hypothetical protein